MIEIKSAPPTMKPNKILLPVTKCHSIEEFNEVYMYWRKRELEGKIRYGIEITRSGGIKLAKFIPNCYEVKVDKNLGCELIVLSCTEEGEPAFYRLQFNSTKNEHNMYGTMAYRAFVEELRKDNINIEDYFIDNGEEVKQTIEKPIIDVERNSFIGLTFENCHHLDIHSSYPSGMAEFIPEWRPTIERLYNERKKHPKNKDILNMTCGYFQSIKGTCRARLSHVSKYAIARNNQKIREMAQWLKDTGRTVLLYNTDGIWFTGEPTNLNSKLLGEFEEDHKNCKFRIKSKGAYEFIEDGKYTPVVRGATKLDRIKNRTMWNWGDIFREDATPVRLIFNREVGIEFLGTEFNQFNQWEA